MTASQHKVQPSPIVGSPSNYKISVKFQPIPFFNTPSLYDFHGFKLDSLLRSPDN